MTKLNQAIPIRYTLSAATAVLLLCAALTGVSADAAPSEPPKTLEVGSASVTLYADRSLKGTQSGTLSRGRQVSAVQNGDGSCTVYDDAGNLLGYCSPVDLVEPGTPLFVLVPYLYTTDFFGSPVVFDLIDLDLYLAENASNIYKSVPDGGEEKTILLSRHLMDDLEAAAGDLAKAGVNLWVDDGYRPDDAVLVPGMAACNTGCVLNLTLISGSIRLNQNPSSAAYIQARNILRRHGFFPSESDSSLFCYDDFKSHYGVNLDISDLPRVAAD